MGLDIADVGMTVTRGRGVYGWSEVELVEFIDVILQIIRRSRLGHAVKSAPIANGTQISIWRKRPPNGHQFRTMCHEMRSFLDRPGKATLRSTILRHKLNMDKNTTLIHEMDSLRLHLFTLSETVKRNNINVSMWIERRSLTPFYKWLTGPSTFSCSPQSLTIMAIPSTCLVIFSQILGWNLENSSCSWKSVQLVNCFSRKRISRFILDSQCLIGRVL